MTHIDGRNAKSGLWLPLLPACKKPADNAPPCSGPRSTAAIRQSVASRARTPLKKKQSAKTEQGDWFLPGKDDTAPRASTRTQCRYRLQCPVPRVFSSCEMGFLKRHDQTRNRSPTLRWRPQRKRCAGRFRGTSSKTHSPGARPHTGWLSAYTGPLHPAGGGPRAVYSCGGQV